MKIRNTLITISLLGLLFATTVVRAQLASGIPHLFTTAPVPPAFPAGGTNFLLPPGSMTQFDSLFAPPGFSFNFCGRTYTQVVISSNGWIALCPTSTQLSSIPGPMPVNDLAHNT